MANIFDTLTEQDVLNALRTQANRSVRDNRAKLDTAVDYLEGRMETDLCRELDFRYQNAQAGSRGEEIHPVTVPITQRFAAEVATTFNKPVGRELVGEDGTVSEEATEAFNDALAAIGYNEILHRADTLMAEVHTAGIWYQIKNGKLKPRVIPPQRIHAVLHPDAVFFDEADQEDYLGFVIKLTENRDKMNTEAADKYVFITPAQHVYYAARTWSEPLGKMDIIPNSAFTADQSVNDLESVTDAIPSMREAPLQMLTLWHSYMPLDEVIISADPSSALLNRELNVQLSVLFDTTRTQGFSQLVMKLTDPDAAPPRVAYGSKYAIPVSVEEDLSYTSAPNNYGDLTSTFEYLLKTLAVSKRLPPGDLQTEGPSPQSGFAKLVESQPKIDMRNERQARLKMMEEVLAWPRLRAVLQVLGVLGQEADGLSLRVQYAPLEFPMNVQEEVADNEFKFKHGLSSPTELLMSTRDLTKEEAEEAIAENKEGTREQREEEQAQMRARFGQDAGAEADDDTDDETKEED